MPQEAFELCQRLQNNMGQAMLGKPEVTETLITSLLSGGHILLEDIPGVGKTLAARALAASIEGSFSRLQFTPDLLPSDITGSSIYRSNTHDFEFSPGPIFANVVLADEINRAPPRTQSALLEAMSDNQVSVDGKTYPLPDPFIVVATQNPFEYEGTYPLPESQLDRFLMRVSVGYPSREAERDVLLSHRSGNPVDALQPVATTEEIVKVKSLVRDIKFDPTVAEYMLDAVDSTRDFEGFSVGVSTRGALAFYRSCQARAVLKDRDYVIPDDIKTLAVPTLSHRVMPAGVFQGGNRTAVETQIADLIQQIPVPM